MLTAVIWVAIVPGFLILGLGIAARVVAAQRVKAPIVQYAPERGSTVLRDALLVNADRRAASAALIDLAVQRKVRLLASADKREPIGVELVPGAALTRDETRLLEALFGPEHTHTRVRRFTADRRALAGRLRSVLQRAEDALVRDGLIASQRVSWPSVTLMLLAYVGILVEALLIVFALVGTDWASLGTAVLALAATVAAIIVTPPTWRRLLPASRTHREHLEGLRQYLALAEADRMRVLQSPSGAELRPMDAAAAVGTADAASDAATAGIGVATAADTAVARFHLHERLLPYAVLFGLEREWIARLRLEHELLEHSGVELLVDAIDVTADIALALEAAGGAIQLVAAVGDLVDAGGSVLEGVGGIFEGFSV